MTTNQIAPLVGMWDERNRLIALGNAADDEHESGPLFDKAYAIEHRIAKAKARTLTGVLVQVKLHDDLLGHDRWVHSATLTRNVVTALERMAGAS